MLGQYTTVFICHDCRNVVTKTCQKGLERFSEDCLTLSDIEKLIGSAKAHRQHNFSIEAALARAEANVSLSLAVRNFEAHSTAARHAADQFTRLTGFLGSAADEAVSAIAAGLSKSTLHEPEHAEERTRWLIQEGQRLHRLEKQQKAIREGTGEKV